MMGTIHDHNSDENGNKDNTHSLIVNGCTTAIPNDLVCWTFPVAWQRHRRLARGSWVDCRLISGRLSLKWSWLWEWLNWRAKHMDDLMHFNAKTTRYFVYPNLIHEAKVSGSFWASAGNHRCGTSGFRGFILCIFGVRRRFERKFYRKQRFPSSKEWDLGNSTNFGTMDDGNDGNCSWGAFFSLNVIDLPEFFEDHREEPPIFGGSNMADFWLSVYMHMHFWSSICVSTHISFSLSLYMHTYTIDLYTHICIWFCIFMRIHI